MGNIRLKQQINHSQKENDKFNSKQIKGDKGFVLSDVSKEELSKRRIPVYPYVL